MPNTKIVTKDSLPASGEFKSYRKIANTLIAGPYDPPVEVHTQEGRVLESNEITYIAVDVEGYPYPIKRSVFEKSYELEAPDAPGPHGSDGDRNFTGLTSSWAASQFVEGDHKVWRWWARFDGHVRQGQEHTWAAAVGAARAEYMALEAAGFRPETE